MVDLTGRAILSPNAVEIEKGAFCFNKNLKTVTVPSNIRRIGEDAFRDCRNLTTVVLQEGLEEIGPMAFWVCKKLETLVIPTSVQRVSQRAFGCCKGLKQVVVLGKDTVLEDGVFESCSWNMELLLRKELRVDERLHLFGGTFLYQPRTEKPKRNHCKDRVFRQLVGRCADGDAAAMWEMGQYLRSLGEEPFYAYAANFWWYKAQKHGHPEAKRWLTDWIHHNPDLKMPAMLNEFLSGYHNGWVLNYCGFPYFDPDRSYSIARPDEFGVVEVSAWSSTVDADSDGFGMEECYDWWYLDESLRELPGVAMVHDFSRNDKRANEKKFKALHDRAAEIIRKRR